MNRFGVDGWLILDERCDHRFEANPMKFDKSSRLSELTDIEAVPLNGDPRVAVKPTPSEVAITLSTEILICGGGLGGVAAAMAAAASGARVCLLEETEWLGGQATSQGVSAPDEHSWIESFGGTRTYQEFRAAIRDHYAPKMHPPEDDEIPLNPGNCWVSALAFEPRVAVGVIGAILEPYCLDGRLQIMRRTKAYACHRAEDRIVSVDAMNLESGVGTRFLVRHVIDATEMGDLLPLAGLPYRLGAESQDETGEPHAPQAASRTCVQGCTYPFILEKSPTVEEPCPAPVGYARFRDEQPYSLRINIHGKADSWRQYAMFEQLPGTCGSVWEYRRLIAGDQFLEPRNDLSMINWPGNDYFSRSLLDLEAEELAEALQEAKRLSLGLAHWFQTEVPPPAGQSLSLRTDLMGTSDGLSKFPYIREARRIIPLKTIVEQNVRADQHEGVRSQAHEDAVGIGHYALDVHDTCDGAPGYYVATKPFQIPLGALIPAGLDNFLAGGKNFGVTHITNGCYRLHPVEWNVGEVAGLLAAFSLETALAPAQIWADELQRRRFQMRCLKQGIPGSWLIDVPPDHPAFIDIHLLVLLAGPPSDADLAFDPAASVSPELSARWTRVIEAAYPGFAAPHASGDREEFARAVRRHLETYF